MQFVVGSLIFQYDTDGLHPIPDLRFGFTPKELNEWYRFIGKQGCLVYTKIALLDFFPYMFLQTLCCGSLLYIQLEKLNLQASVSKSFLSVKLTLLAPLMMFFDCVETSVAGYGAYAFPESISDSLIHVASIASQLKWVTLFLLLVLLLGLVIRNNLVNSYRERAGSKSQ